jgi:hypothetical protein
MKGVGKMIILEQREETLGSFKRHLWEAANRIAPEDCFHSSEVEMEDGWIYLHDSKTPAKALILTPSKASRPHTPLTLGARSCYPLLNPPRSSLTSKPEWQKILRDLEIPTPTYYIHTTKPGIAKPVYGQGGKGIKKGKGVYTQDGIFNPFTEKGIGWDIRVVMFMGGAIGAMLRINPFDFRSNIHQGGHPVTFWEGKTNPIVNHEIRDVYPQIVKWLGMTAPDKSWFVWGKKLTEATRCAYFGMDIIFDEARKPFVIDINPTAGQDANERNIIRVARSLRLLRDKEYINKEAKIKVEALT